MPLPTGAWKANVNGIEAALILEAPDQNGVFAGTLFDTSFRGFWTESSQTVTFSVLVFFGAESATVAFFSGHLFRTPPNPEPGRDVLATLAGSVQMNVGDAGPATFPALGTARRNVFGWFAQITEVL